MKYIGIDYGARKIGVALSDSGGTIAFPHSVIPNDSHAVSSIVAIAVQEDAGAIVAGDTRTESGASNDITEAFAQFADVLGRVAGVTVVVVPEHGTSGAARAGGGEGIARGEISAPRKVDDENIDARAAALILQRFLDTKK